MENLENFAVDLLLEHASISTQIRGSFINSENVEIPLVGITGFENEYRNGDKRSVWVTGEIISPTFFGNNGCASRSHIEGIITDLGQMHFLEQVYDYPAFGGSCYEYLLVTDEFTKTPLRFSGGVLSRDTRDDLKPIYVGRAIIEMNPFWSMRNEGGKSRSRSLRYNDRPFHTQGEYIPQFWDEFINQINSMGYAHPYKPFEHPK